MGNLPLNRNGHEPCTFLNENGIGNAWKNKNTKFTKKDSRSVCELREAPDFTPYGIQNAFHQIRVKQVEMICRLSRVNGKIREEKNMRELCKSLKPFLQTDFHPSTGWIFSVAGCHL